jgi:hypothetical protein
MRKGGLNMADIVLNPVNSRYNYNVNGVSLPGAGTITNAGTWVA